MPIDTSLGETVILTKVLTSMVEGSLVIVPPILLVVDACVVVLPREEPITSPPLPTAAIAVS